MKIISFSWVMEIDDRWPVVKNLPANAGDLRDMSSIPG